MSCFDEIATNCIIYTMSHNFTSYAICLLTLTMYKYNELQMFDATQKLSYKASCKTTLFSHSDILLKHPTYIQKSCQCLHF